MGAGKVTEYMDFPFYVVRFFRQKHRRLFIVKMKNTPAIPAANNRCLNAVRSMAGRPQTTLAPTKKHNNLKSKFVPAFLKVELIEENWALCDAN
jgi:hypothetical protein